MELRIGIGGGGGGGGGVSSGYEDQNWGLVVPGLFFADDMVVMG